MQNRLSARQDDDMCDTTYLRARARDLRAAAETARDPDIVSALRQIAWDFDSEAEREETRVSNPGAGH
jgi:hypothetical protein